MQFDLAAIPATHDAPDGRLDAGVIASVIGLAAVVKALAPLLGAGRRIARHHRTGAGLFSRASDGACQLRR